MVKRYRYKKMVRRARGTGTPQEHTNALLEVNMKEKIAAINGNNSGFLDLIPALDDRMFSTAPVDVTAKNLYDSKMKKLKKVDKKFMEVGQIASQHITRLTEWINEHEKLALADYMLITSLNKEAAGLGDNNRRNIDAALNEVIEAL